MKSHWADSIWDAISATGLDEVLDYATFDDWWRGCQQGSLMLRMLDALGYDNEEKLRLVACRLIRQIEVGGRYPVWSYLDDDERAFMETMAERYTNGEPHRLFWDEVWRFVHRTERPAGERAEALNAVDTLLTTGPGMEAVTETLWAVRRAARIAAQGVVSSEEGFMDMIAEQEAEIIRGVIPAGGVRMLLGKEVLNTAQEEEP